MSWGEMLAQQAGTEAVGSGVRGMVDLAFTGARRRANRLQNRDLIELQSMYNKDMELFNIKNQMEMWHNTNAEAQMKHIKGAGLNPALMYEGGGAGGTTTANITAGNVSGPQADPRPIRTEGGQMGILMPAQVKLMEAQARNLDADTAKKSGVETQLGMTTIEKLKAETTNVKAQTSLTNIETGIAQIRKEIAETSQEDVTDALSLNAQKIQQEVFQLQNQTDISDATKKTIINTVKQQYVNAVITGLMMKSGMQVNEASINKMAADIVQKGRELDIKEFEAEIRANNPSIGEIGGSMMNSIKQMIDKVMGIKEKYTKPNQVK